MGKEISLIAFLDEVVSRNTQHYRKDFELDAQDILELQAGDVIPLTKLINSDVELYVEDKNCFQARIGHTKLRKAVQISKIL